ncbi:homoserine dehydrogenase [Bathymodiolus platifrons methanotrophic gill symbiont]|uniref:homoserine dehydrogenase n=1 Tax=Bathymodiolus platifrons methanotrophic gill symbiont TaxID=113268 RepID=UPI0011CA6733|nr:homoserine dehydrogenase [Bathymodiolus platifrons methanotrophic gill symbiont]TXK97732.1 homoserine dehydrogenase [Methylococcaceae bacterium HT1]TXL15797.1 homoserine dehydrogenase [Methylococcaceae bacterium HT3]TXL22290.1 homoserine dehydrogenase [Methylococcaceae bacterium HT2]GFO75708.1 homoserine dehydrogenase [Bathymodiolus platifrons methanotrophic gill symbiont]
MKPVKVGVLGLGTVGGGTVNVLKRNAQEISRRAGREIIITRASARDLTRERLCDTQDLTLSTDPYEIINDPEIKIILELIGGTSLAKELVLHAIANGKHIVTANKALIALHGNEIFAAASKANVMVTYEAAVAGGIPIIKAIREGLSGNQINWLAGIINGTGNFILTEMRDKGRDFSDVLAEAQELGYAEADPTFDVEGIDAGHKLMILASIAFGIPLQFDNVFTEGITKITRADVEYAGELGYRIKHLGIARKTEKGIELRVHPTLIPERRLIANVDGVMNAVLVQADAVGPTLYYGAGAGAEATASAVVADIVDVVRSLTLDVENRVPYLGFQPDAIIDLPILPREEIETTYYLRLTVEDKPGALADITNILARQNISIEALIQKEPQHDETTLPIIMLTQKTIEKEMDAAIAAIENLASVTGQVTRIRLETLG